MMSAILPSRKIYKACPCLERESETADEVFMSSYLQAKEKEKSEAEVKRALLSKGTA